MIHFLPPSFKNVFRVSRFSKIFQKMLPVLLIGGWTAIPSLMGTETDECHLGEGVCRASVPTEGLVLAMLLPQEEGEEDANDQEESDSEESEDGGNGEEGAVEEDGEKEGDQEEPPAWMYRGRVFAPEYLTDPVEVEPPTLQERTIAPVISVKLARYGSRLLERYDENADGKLQKSEWTQMQGSPQTIDFDGDFVLTIQEIVRHIALYGRHRSIYHPYVSVQSARRVSRPQTQMQLFQPASGTLEEEETDAEQEEGRREPAADVSAEEIESGEVFGEEQGEESESEEGDGEDKSEEVRKAEEEALERALGELAPASARKYYTPPGKLRGLPTWFVTRDTNGDGQVELHEFAPSLSTPAVAQFGRLDKNGDGFLTPKELTSGN